MKAMDAVENLRKLADLLEKHGDAEIRMSSATVWFKEKDAFLAVAREFPHPFLKKHEEGKYGDLVLDHGILDETGSIRMRIQRSTVCVLKKPAQPAEYECPSILSPKEELELEAQ